MPPFAFLNGLRMSEDRDDEGREPDLPFDEGDSAGGSRPGFGRYPGAGSDPDGREPPDSGEEPASEGASPGEGEAEGSQPPPEAERLFGLARESEREGRRDEAKDLYRRVLAVNPGHVRARNNLGVLLDREGDPEAALEHFHTALQYNSENPDVLANLGAALGSLGRYEEAERELRKALRLEPNRPDVRTNLGLLHLRKGLYAQAESGLRWVCEHDPHNGPAHLYRGEALNRLGRADEALEVLERASHLEPENPRIFYLMGILYDRKHLSHEAAIMYRKARELTGR